MGARAKEVAAVPGEWDEAVSVRYWSRTRVYSRDKPWWVAPIGASRIVLPAGVRGAKSRAEERTRGWAGLAVKLRWSSYAGQFRVLVGRRCW